jgi:hypothetical protein
VCVEDHSSPALYAAVNSSLVFMILSMPFGSEYRLGIMSQWRLGARMRCGFLIYLVYETNLTRAFDFLRCWCGTWSVSTLLFCHCFPPSFWDRCALLFLTDETAFLLSIIMEVLNSVGSIRNTFCNVWCGTRWFVSTLLFCHCLSSTM